MLLRVAEGSNVDSLDPETRIAGAVGKQSRSIQVLPPTRRTLFDEQMVQSFLFVQNVHHVHQPSFVSVCQEAVLRAALPVRFDVYGEIFQCGCSG